MKIRLTFTAELLGTTPASAEVHRDYVASKAPDAAKMEEEVAERGVDPVVEGLMTVFPKMDDKTPMMWDYQVNQMAC